MTLSELIEACGDKFLCLNRYQHLWMATGVKDKKVFDERADTPEESVANLLLKLNDKD